MVYVSVNWYDCRFRCITIQESKAPLLKYSLRLKKEISKLPKGSIKKRKIGNNYYFYLQYRDGKKVIQKYLGKQEPEGIIKKINKRKAFEKQLKKISEALKLLTKIK